MLLSDYIYLFILFAGAIFGLVNFKQLNTAFKIFTVFLLITFCKETPNNFLVANNESNALLQNLYTPFHVGSFAIIYYSLLAKSKFKKLVLYTGIAVFSIVLIGIITSAMDHLPWVFISLDSAMLVFFSILYFFNLMQNPVEQNILASGNVWLSTSVLLYFTATFIFWISYNYISSQPKAISELLFYILDQLGSIHYFLLFIALYFHVRETRKNVFVTSQQ